MKRQNPEERLRLILWLVLLAGAPALHAQQLTSYSISVGVTTQPGVQPTAAFGLSAGVHWQLPWLLFFQRSVGDLETEPGGTVRTSSLALLAASDFANHRLLLGAGAVLHAQRRAEVGAADERQRRALPSALVGLRLPLAGPGVLAELLARADLLDARVHSTASFGIRITPRAPNTLARGEPMPQRELAERAAVWSDVLMQLVLLQQSLESFTRVRELENGIDLEFQLGSLTLYDDVARAARVLAAADPPVTITVFAPNAGRTAAAVTAGSFPAERVRLQRADRVYLRVER